jgi:4-hydroxythreonine-4-phosphate dehydrogenase
MFWIFERRGRFEPGVNDKVGYAVKSFIAATDAKEGLVDVLVTAPINKYNIQSEEFKFPVIRII